LPDARLLASRVRFPVGTIFLLIFSDYVCFVL
jgi:hypothetical protein